MRPAIFIAGIGNIFCGDDAFGVAVAQKLLEHSFTGQVRVMDVGIRSLDLVFALLDNPDLTLLIDAVSRGGQPGTLCTIAIGSGDIPDASDESSVVNSHALDPVRVLSMAKGLGAKFRKILLIGCEPLIVDCDDSGHIGLSEAVQAAVPKAVHTILSLIEEFQHSSDPQVLTEEVCHESI